MPECASKGYTLHSYLLQEYLKGANNQLVLINNEDTHHSEKETKCWEGRDNIEKTCEWRLIGAFQVNHLGKAVALRMQSNYLL